MRRRHCAQRSARTDRALCWIVLVALTAALLGCQATPPAANPAGQPQSQVPAASEALPTSEPTANPSPTPTHTPPPTPEPLEVIVALEPATLAQGHTGMIRLTTSRPAEIRATVADQQVYIASPDGLTHHALFGVHALYEPGPLPVSVSAEAQGGTRTMLQAAINVVPGGYESEEVVLDPSVSALLDPAIAQPENVRMAQVYSTVSPERLWEGPFAWPINGYVTSEFGTRRLYDGHIDGYHAGIDLATDLGTPVLAPAPGIVVLADALQVRGNSVVLDHGQGVLSAYSHLDSIAVEVGQTVTTGDSLGEVGTTGLSTGPHLHWELHVCGIAVSPTEWTETAFP